MSSSSLNVMVNCSTCGPGPGSGSPPGSDPPPPPGSLPPPLGVLGEEEPLQAERKSPNKPGMMKNSFFFIEITSSRTHLRNLYLYYESRQMGMRILQVLQIVQLLSLGLQHQQGILR